MDNMPESEKGQTGQVITLAQFRNWLLAFADSINANLDYLTELDASIGDADHGINMQRGMRKVRFFACQQDFSHADPDDPLPEQVASGEEPFMVIGAMAGG